VDSGLKDQKIDAKCKMQNAKVKIMHHTVCIFPFEFCILHWSGVGVRLFNVVTKGATVVWRWLRAVSGDDAYERYVRHWRACRPGEPLDRKTFFVREQERKWGGVRRCC
jgi:uncharacterized short protein YbdD (DUF466 family)